MVDTVTSQVLMDGPKYYKAKFTNSSDGTGETAVQKIDFSELFGSPVRASIQEIEYSTYGMGVNILWDATTDVLIHAIPQDAQGSIKNIPAVWPDDVAGNTSDVLFTTLAAASGDSYSITITLRKKYK